MLYLTKWSRGQMSLGPIVAAPLLKPLIEAEAALEAAADSRDVVLPWHEIPSAEKQRSV